MENGRKKVLLIEAGFTPSATGTVVDLTSNFSADITQLADWTNEAYAAGTPASVAITVGGTYAAGDVAAITLKCSDTQRGVYTMNVDYEVQAGDAVADVAAALAAIVNSKNEGSLFTAGASGAVVTITKKDADVDFTYGVETVSAAGTLTPVYTAATIEIGTTEDIVSEGFTPSTIPTGTFDKIRMVYKNDVPQPFADTVVDSVSEMVLYLDAGEGASLITLLDSL